MELSKDELNAALEKVGAMFGSTAPPPPQPAEDTIGAMPMPSKKPAPKSGRARVDSAARPPEFMKNIKKESAPKQAVNFHDFSVHGIHEPVLRQRLESKAIDVATLNRVQIEFQTHDKLSAEELTRLSGLAEQAHQLHRDHDIAGAEKLYEQILDTDPVDFDCLNNLGKLVYAKGQLDRARDLFDRALVVRPEREKTMYHLGRVLFDLKTYERSKVLFEQVVQGYKGEIIGDKCDQPTYHNAVAMLGLIHQQVFKDFEKAEQLYGVVLAADKDHVLALDHKSALLVRRGQNKEAANLHRTVCTLDPHHTKKPCPYLHCLFPDDSEMLHPVRSIQRRLEDWSPKFGQGSLPKSWTNHPMRSLKKKVARSCGAGQD
mmetsp:Transcript_22019/g.60317  ORF Transcript_22019/g.60317 Transcript_22019/m.60317 type:complete len:374 (-) Transcript_22019:117-1238(-)